MAPGPSDRATRLLLGLLLAWALALRVWTGLPDPGPGRFWDERYGLENIASLLRGGGLRPANGFHPSLSYLPQAALLAASQGLHRWTGIEALAVLGERTFTPTAYRLCRLSQALMGVASLWLMFLIGRRLGGNGVGLLAALLLASVPWHVRQSVIYKPDILLVLTLLIAFWLTLDAVERPTLGAYLATGAAIGVALSSKFNAGPIALPLTAAALFRARRDRRTLLWLVAAGATALALFLLLNPYLLIEPEIFQRSFGKTLRDYARKGLERGSGHPLGLPWHAVSSLLSKHFHGFAVGLAGLGGLLLLTVRAWRRPAEPASRITVLAVVFVLGYVAAYSLSTTNPSAHNWLPLTPFVALGAAALAAAAWRAMRRRAAWLARPAVAAPLIGLLSLAATWPGNAFAYRDVVPTTSQAAGAAIAHRWSSVDGRLTYWESPVVPGSIKRRGLLAGSFPVDRLAELTRRQLDRSDAEVFLSSRLEDEIGGDFYRRRADRADARIDLRGRLFHARGPALTILLRDWRRAGNGVPGAWVRDDPERPVFRSTELSRVRPGRMVSIGFSLPSTKGPPVAVRLQSAEESLPALAYARTRRGVLYTTPRFRAGPSFELVVEGALDGARSQRIPLIIRRWHRQRPSRAAGGRP